MSHTIDLGNRREMFVDRHLIDRMEGTAKLKMNPTSPTSRVKPCVFGLF